MQAENQTPQNAKLAKIRALIKEKKSKQAKNKKLKPAVSSGISRPTFDPMELMEQEMEQEVDPSDPDYKHKLKYEDDFDDVIEEDVVQKNVDNEDSDDDDYESIDAEEIVSVIFLNNRPAKRGNCFITRERKT